MGERGRKGRKEVRRVKRKEGVREGFTKRGSVWEEGVGEGGKGERERGREGGRDSGKDEVREGITN